MQYLVTKLKSPDGFTLERNNCDTTQLDHLILPKLTQAETETLKEDSFHGYVFYALSITVWFPCIVLPTDPLYLDVAGAISLLLADPSIAHAVFRYICAVARVSNPLLIGVFTQVTPSCHDLLISCLCCVLCSFLFDFHPIPTATSNYTVTNRSVCHRTQAALRLQTLPTRRYRAFVSGADDGSSDQKRIDIKCRQLLDEYAREVIHTKDVVDGLMVKDGFEIGVDKERPTKETMEEGSAKAEQKDILARRWTQVRNIVNACSRQLSNGGKTD